jgi:hypothetical protein
MEEDVHGMVPLVIMTHTASEGAMRQAMENINRLTTVHAGTVRMRVRD